MALSSSRRNNMLPTDLAYLAQERCQELRGEIRRPSTPFFEFKFGKMFSKLFASSEQAVSKPKAQMSPRAKAQ
jgi:hypothetical protein